MVYLLLALAVLVVLFYFVPKRAALILSGFTAIIIAIALGIYWHDLQEKQLFEQVDVTLSATSEHCTQEKALETLIVNGSEQDVYRVHFYFTVYREGYSTAISRSYRNEIQVDKIVKSGSRYSLCSELPEFDNDIPREELRFELERKRVWFEPPVI